VVTNLSISRAWDETREIFRRDGGLFVAVALALIVLPEVVVGIIAPDPGTQPSGTVQLLRLIAGLIALIGQLAIIRLALGPSTTVGNAISHGARRFPAALGAIVLLIIAMMLITIPVVLILAPLLGVDLTRSANLAAEQRGPLGVLVLIVLVVILAISVRFTLLSPVASGERIGPIAVLKRTWELTKGHYWRLLGLILLLLVAALFLLIVAGMIGGLLAKMISPDVAPFSIGALILALFAGLAQGAFSLMASLMLARVYAQVGGKPEPVEEVLR
jgi:hypothetical protein